MNKTTINFAPDHQKADTQLFIALSGGRVAMIQQLENIINEFKCAHGKPRQGIFIHYDVTCEVITPKWEGKNC